MDPRVPWVACTELLGRPRILAGQMRGICAVFTACGHHLYGSHVCWLLWRQPSLGEVRQDKQRKSAQGPSSGPADCAVARAILCAQPTKIVNPLNKSAPSSSNGQDLSNRSSKMVHCQLRTRNSAEPGAVQPHIDGCSLHQEQRRKSAPLEAAFTEVR